MSSNILKSLYAFSISSSLALIAKPIPGPYFSFSFNFFKLFSILSRVFFISCIFNLFFTRVVSSGLDIDKYGGLDIDRSIGLNGLNGFKSPNANLASINSNSFSSI